MSFSLIGIIWVQVYWIKNGISVKKAQFDQLVNDALNHAVTNIEEVESIEFIHDQLAGVASDIIIEDRSKSNDSKKIKKWVQKITKTVDSDSMEDQSYNYSVTTDSDNDEMEMTVKINGEVQTIDIKSQLKNLENLFDFDSLEFDDKHEVVVGERFNNIMVKMVKEFKGIDKPIEHLLKSITLEPLISSSLEDNGINSPFTYAIIHDDKIIEEFSSDNYFVSDNNYTVNLFKHNLVENSAQLSINFKGKRQFILRSMGLMLALSVLFTLIILITFATTVHYMIKQKKLSEMKNDFINNMTHEFKTPISTISLAVDSITHPKIIDDKTQINHFADIIRKENLRMNKQVESVLNTAQGEKGELEFDKAEIDLTAIIQKIPERMRLQLDSNDAQLSINQSTPIIILGDEMHLQNAICNLIDNSIKYCSEKPEISIETNLVNGFCEIKITDNGIGMSNETQKKVFDKFYRVEKGNIHTVKGFGIGLSYVKAIVNAHKGLIALKSKLNKGTIITINIPKA